MLSTVQMPSGIPVATVAIDGAQNAALLAAQMLAIYDGELAARLDELRREMCIRDRVYRAPAVHAQGVPPAAAGGQGRGPWTSPAFL